jgi:hypothetical protein
MTTKSLSTRESVADRTTEREAARPSRRGWLLRRLPWWAEILVAVGFYFLYDSVQALAGSDRDKAFQNGRDIVSAEKSLHIWIEPHFNRWLTDHHTFGLVAGYDYGLAHALVTATVLGVVWWRRPAIEPRLRNSLVAMSLVALVVYWLYPVAPPRMTVPTLTDTLLTDNVLGARHVHQGLVNLYAAMPSLHVAWALWCAGAIVFSLRSRWRQLAWLYPLWTTFVIISTANHYLLDAFAGAVLAGVPLLLLARRFTSSASGPLLVVGGKDGEQIRGRARQDPVDS